MTGFLEMDEDKGKKMYYKSPLIEEPASKIDWSELIEETKKFVRESWPEVASEYNSSFCGRVKIVDPFSGDNIELGERAKSASEVESGGAFAPFKTYKDTKYKDFDSFILNAEGDYNDKEIKAVKSYYKES